MGRSRMRRGAGEHTLSSGTSSDYDRVARECGHCILKLGRWGTGLARLDPNAARDTDRARFRFGFDRELYVSHFHLTWFRKVLDAIADFEGELNEDLLETRSYRTDRVG